MMDATPGSNKTSPAADAVPSAVQQAAEHSSSPEPDDAVAGAVRASGATEDDDEQVERFYALLDNIRAMRGMGMVSRGDGTAEGRKRARDAEPPWRPAFRMEDFELEDEDEVESDSVACAGEKKRRRESSDSAKRPAANEEEEEGEVVEANGPRRRQPESSHKTRRAGVLAADT